jgi:PIN domain nuclease of toxin-antitoxin system
MILLDASAVLGYLQNEPGWETIATEILTGQAHISVVNQAEVLGKLSDWGMSWQDAQKALSKLALRLELFTLETALESARLRPLTRVQGLSLGDRACLATARLRQCPVLTGDRSWLKVADALGLKITSFRPVAHGTTPFATPIA